MVLVGRRLSWWDRRGGSGMMAVPPGAITDSAHGASSTAHRFVLRSRWVTSTCASGGRQADVDLLLDAGGRLGGLDQAHEVPVLLER